jgi:pimeloyl-ACP methyl ester carboxylesterase
VPYVHARGIDFFYEEHGSGPHVIVAHGALGSVRFAEAFGLKASVLAARGLHVVAYDARGHGRSGYTTRPADYDKAALADDLVAVMDGLGLERASLCGTSMGATTALLLAQRRPERVEKLVLRSPAPFGADMAGPRRMMHGLTGSYRVLGVPLTARMISTMPGLDAPGRRRALLRDQRRVAIVPALRGFLAEPLSTDGLDRIAAPALVLAHPGDPLHPLRSGEILRARLPRADLRVAPSATYWHDRSDELADVIAAFLQREHSPVDEAAAGP